MILSSLLGNSLVPILLEKATLPAPQIWVKVQRDLQQQFLQVRREFLDTLLYIQRALKSLNAPNSLLELVFNDLQQLSRGPPGSSPKSLIETRLRALIIVAEEEESSADDEDNWTPSWQNLASLIFTSPEITHDSVNAKLAISLIGSLLPLMKSTPAADEAVKMLLGQLQSNSLVREECLGALQQAADAEVALLRDPQIIASLLGLLASSPFDLSQRSKFIRLLSRLITDLTENEAQRWDAFNTLIQASAQNYSELAQVLRTPFNFESAALVTAPSVYRACLNQLKQTASSDSGEALLAAWLSLSGSQHFATFEASDPTALLSSFFSCALNDPQFFVLGSKLLAAWVYGMSRANQALCLSLLESVTRDQILASSPSEPHEDGLEALLDAWIHLIKAMPPSSITGDSHVFRLNNWILERVSIGHLSVPLLRSFTRFQCVLIEASILKDPHVHLFPILQVILSVGISGKIGRSGMEILARIPHDISLQHPDTFRAILNQLVGAETCEIAVNLADRRAFLRNLGAAHTIKKFKSVLVEFCLQTRGINS